MTNVLRHELKIAPRDGYARGQDLFEQILAAAHTILIEQGARALTMRRIAETCGLKAGNLSHYFKSKEDLIRDLLEAIIGGYEEMFDEILAEPDLTPEHRFERMVSLVLQDITSKRTTRIFPELWAMSNHDPFVQERVDELYRRARLGLAETIRALNPSLSKDEVELLALFVSGSMEGMTIFAGYEKPWRSRMPEIEAVAIRSFSLLVKSATSGDLIPKRS